MTETLQQFLTEQIAALEELRNADEGWDGYFARRPVGHTIDAAIVLMQLLAREGLLVPEASMGTDGYAGLYLNREGVYLDLEVLPDGRVEWLFEVEGGWSVECTEPFDGLHVPIKLAEELRKVTPTGDVRH